MFQGKKNYRTLRVSLPENTAAGLQEKQKITKPEKYGYIVGMAIIPVQVPTGMEGYQVNLANDNEDYTNPTPASLFTANEGVAPDHKFLDVFHKCDDTVNTYIKLVTSIDVPGSTTLEFDVVLAVVEKKDYID